MAVKHRLTLFLVLIITDLSYSYKESNSSNTVLGSSHKDLDSNGETRVLSRRKRFIVFPDGSSFQLVFCAQNQGYFQIGDIFWLGNTAALAWELPTDPQLFYMFKKDLKQIGQRRGDFQKNIYYLDERGKLIAKVPYKKRILVNPAFAKRKRSVDFIKTKENRAKSNTLVDSFSIENMHKLQEKVNFLKCKDPKDCNAAFHREGRKGLYEKLETLINALGWHGRQCVLRMLCEAGKDKSEQGTFLDEIVRAVFTLPGGQEFDREHHKQYDIAHRAAGDCKVLYPECANKVTGEPLYS